LLQKLTRHLLHYSMTTISLRGIKKLVILGSVLLVASMFASQTEGQEGTKARNGRTESLPEGEGRHVMLQACVQCHDFKNIVAQRKTLSAWRRTVDEMGWRGAPLTPGEAEIVTKYLASSFGPEKRDKDSATQSETKEKFAEHLPEGKGRALVLQSCVECHDLENIVSMRATADEWRLTVNKMIRQGAEIGSGDAEIIISYLASSFAPDKPIPGGLKKKR
jgi:mono/diheme cytochrome c family protein